MTTATRRKRPTLTSGGRAITARPLPGVGLDPDVFPAQRDRDYEAVAETSWYSALMWASDLAADDLVLEQLADRALRAAEWLGTHTASDPRWSDALTRKREIENLVDAARIGRRVHAYACWTCCMEVYAALTHLHAFERQSWRVEFAPAMNTDHPSGIWEQLRGDEPLPGEWPPAKGEGVIEGRLQYVEVWDREQRREAIIRRQRRSPK